MPEDEELDDRTDTITTELLIRTPLGDYFARKSGTEGVYSATPVEYKRNGARDCMTMVVFTHVQHIVEHRVHTVKVLAQHL